MSDLLALAFSLDRQGRVVRGVIVGASIAGLSAANALLDRGHTPIVLEAASQFSPKVCGEFLSQEVLPYLEKWQITPPLQVNTARYFFKRKELSFPIKGASMPRVQLETLLHQRFGEVRFGKRVEAVRPIPEGVEIILSTKEKIIAPFLIVAAGRCGGLGAPPIFHYKGIKAHFSHLPLPKGELHMHLLPKTYLGLSTLDENLVVLSCLTKQAAPQPLVEAFIATSPLFSSAKRLTPWIEASVPAFGVKKVPSWAYCIGDALATFPPASGEGLAMGVTSGAMVADFALKGDPKGFYKAWRHRFSRPLTLARLLHGAQLSPSALSCLFPLCSHFPRLPALLLAATRPSL